MLVNNLKVVFYYNLFYDTEFLGSTEPNVMRNYFFKNTISLVVLVALIGISYPPATTSSLSESPKEQEETSSFFEGEDIDILLESEDHVKESIQDYARRRVGEQWDDSHYESLAWIIEHESGWSNTAQNPRSTAYGLAQFLNATWSYVGCKKTDDAQVQVDCMIKYVDLVYGNPKKAKTFWVANKWY